MKRILWTRRARGDLSAIRSFIAQDSPDFATVVVARIIAATDHLVPFPESGRVVPELGLPEILRSFTGRTESSIGSWARIKFTS